MIHEVSFHPTSGLVNGRVWSEESLSDYMMDNRFLGLMIDLTPFENPRLLDKNKPIVEPLPEQPTKAVILGRTYEASEKCHLFLFSRTAFEKIAKARRGLGKGKSRATAVYLANCAHQDVLVMLRIT